MILMTTYLTGQVPFKDVFLHGLIRDAGKQKMSKSKGNIIDPLDMIEKYGTDALRFALIFNTAPGTDIALAEDKIKGMKHFANKLWNITRFILMKLEDTSIPNKKPVCNTQADKTVLNKLSELETEVTKAIENFHIHEAAQSLYQFLWYEFADVYIEASKPQLEEPKLNKDSQAILLYCLTTTLKLLHPFMPFITEHIWSLLEQKQPLIITEWPK
jgi:valyl-tRNA synthetase